MLEADFVKSHGLGNDYLVVDSARFPVPLTPERIRLLCHRHIGLGSDGILEVTVPKAEEVKPRQIQVKAAPKQVEPSADRNASA